jgi:putative RNA 2'-phosphotransferase
VPASGKLLSYLLRHHPEAMGLPMDARGWVAIDALLDALSRHGHVTSRDELAAVVASDDKGRFSLEDGRIRARQGHSVPVELDLVALPPPPRLFHGTVARAWVTIRREGLKRGARHHVHLSSDRETAAKVGARRARPVVLSIDAGSMHAAGHTFFRSENGVWLVEHVPVAFLSEQPDAPAASPQDAKRGRPGWRRD